MPNEIQYVVVYIREEEIKMRLLLWMTFLILLGSCDLEESEPNWEMLLCENVSNGDFEDFRDNCNDYLENLDVNDVESLTLDFVAWLNDMSCIDAQLNCFECLPFDPPASDIELTYLTGQSSQGKKQIILISLSAAGAIRVTDIL
jgi:hypothetical protein